MDYIAELKSLFTSLLAARVSDGTTPTELNAAKKDAQLALGYAKAGLEELAAHLGKTVNHELRTILDKVAPNPPAAPVDPAAQQAQDLKNETEVQP